MSKLKRKARLANHRCHDRRDPGQLRFCSRTSTLDITSASTTTHTAAAPTASYNPQNGHRKPIDRFTYHGPLLTAQTGALQRLQVTLPLRKPLRSSTTDHRLQRGHPQQHHYVVHGFRRRLRHAVVCDTEPSSSSRISRILNKGTGRLTPHQTKSGTASTGVYVCTDL